MNPLTILSVACVLIASVHGGTHRIGRQGWGQPPPQQANQTSITADSASEAVGSGGAISEHESVISVVGSQAVPALLSLSTGSGVGLSQSASNYQQSDINSDGSSQAYQGNSASNNGYANDYLAGDAQGLNVDVLSNGWSAVEGDGAVGQVDALNHQLNANQTTTPPPQNNSGWRR